MWISIIYHLSDYVTRVFCAVRKTSYKYCESLSRGIGLGGPINDHFILLKQLILCCIICNFRSIKTKSPKLLNCSCDIPCNTLAGRYKEIGTKLIEEFANKIWRDSEYPVQDYLPTDSRYISLNVFLIIISVLKLFNSLFWCIDMWYILFSLIFCPIKKILIMKSIDKLYPTTNNNK